MKTLFLNLAVATAVLAPLPAAAAEMTRDGVVYHYDVAEHGQTRRISGTSSDGGSYRLIVSNGRVYGTVNGSPVSFSLSEVVVSHDKEEVASR